jgi:hypothetical protein
MLSALFSPLFHRSLPRFATFATSALLACCVASPAFAEEAAGEAPGAEEAAATPPAEASAPKAKAAPEAAPAAVPKARAKSATTPAATPAVPVDAAAEDIRAMRSNRHIDVVAKDLRLGKTARERLARIAERYAHATGKKLVVTGGTRTPARQAKLMIDKLRHGEDVVALYENKAAAKAIRDAYLQGKEKKLSDKALVRAVRKVIEAQMARGVFISQHLQSGAADVRSRDMSPADVLAFKAAVKAEPGVLLVDERETAAPHFHLGL